MIMTTPHPGNRIYPIVPESSPVQDHRKRPLNDLRISVMDRCNFRCPYCMPADKYDKSFSFLTNEERLSFGEITRMARLFARLGVTKLRLTGGEPLLRKGLPGLINELAGINGIEDIALTTNGMLLRAQAEELKQAGLNRVTVSLDSLDPNVFQQMSGGRGHLKTVLEGIDAAQAAGLTPIKINTVVQCGINDQGILPLLDYFRNSGVIVRLIEYMDVGTLNQWSMNNTVASVDLLQQIQSKWNLEVADANYQGEVASRYLYSDGAGEIGFISSVSEPFCGDCSRARISSDGQLYTCLFSNQGLDLKQQLRSGSSDIELEHLVRSVWRKRRDNYSEMRGNGNPDEGADNRIEMFYIGG